MTHPDLRFILKAMEKTAAVKNFQRSEAVLSFLSSLDLPSEVMSDELKSVADAENGNSQVKDFAVAERGLRFIDTLWSARKDNGPRFKAFDFIYGNIKGMDFRINTQFPHLSGNELRILGPEIQDNGFIHSQILPEA
jgi:hypothetical protein